MRCGVYSSSVPGEGSTNCIHTVGPPFSRPLPFGSWGRALLSGGRISHLARRPRGLVGNLHTC